MRDPVPYLSSVEVKPSTQLPTTATYVSTQLSVTCKIIHFLAMITFKLLKTCKARHLALLLFICLSIQTALFFQSITLIVSKPHVLEQQTM